MKHYKTILTSFFWFSDNTAGIVTRRSGFQQRLQDVHLLPVVVEDSGYPAQSSTGTLNIRVCSCGAEGSLSSCSAETISLPVGLSTGALMAILLCSALLVGKKSVCVFLFTARNSGFAHEADVALVKHQWRTINASTGSSPEPSPTQNDIISAKGWCLSKHKSARHSGSFNANASK